MAGEQPARTTSTGDGLIMPKPHERKAGCPGCGARTATVALTNLVSSHEVCSCNQAEHTHLVERTWHRTCFISANAAGVAAGPQATPEQLARLVREVAEARRRSIGPMAELEDIARRLAIDTEPWAVSCPWDCSGKPDGSDHSDDCPLHQLREWVAANPAPSVEPEPWWKGEHINNGPSWVGPGEYADEFDAWMFGTREIYEFIDPELPYNQRFRTLRHELTIHHDGEELGVLALSSDKWYALAEMALNAGRDAAERGL